MSRSTYRKIFLFTAVGLIGAALLATLGWALLLPGCRGEGCGWLMLIAVFWAYFYLLPPLTVLLIVGFAVSSSYRFRDIGLSGPFCLAPAILIPGTIVSLSNMFQYASLLLGNPWTLVILVPLSCLATCVYLLFFANTGSLASAARSHPSVNRCVVAASVCCFVLGIPYFLINLSFLFHLPMDVIGPRLWYYMIHFPLPTSLSYAFLATQIAFTLGLFFLMRRFRDA